MGGGGGQGGGGMIFFGLVLKCLWSQIATRPRQPDLKRCTPPPPGTSSTVEWGSGCRQLPGTPGQTTWPAWIWAWGWVVIFCRQKILFLTMIFCTFEFADDLRRTKNAAKSFENQYFLDSRLTKNPHLSKATSGKIVILVEESDKLDRKWSQPPAA